MDTEQLFYTQNGYDRADTGPLTTAMEDYLEMICRLTRSGGYTRISALARELHVQPSSASKMAALLRCVLISEGSANATAVSVAKVVSEALKCGATGVMLAHNHPRGITLPSSSDMAVTREIYRALRLVNIQLVEHLIFADNEFLSFVQSNYMDSIRQSVQD